MDIRKWLTAKSSASSSNIKTEIQTKDNKSPKKNVSKSSKKRRIIESDSDEEPIPNTPKEKASASSSSKTNSQKHVDEQKVSVKQREVSDFFGSGPIVRSGKKEPQKKKVKEENIHEDNEFEATLLMLDSAKSPEEKKVNGSKRTASEKEKSKEKVKTPPVTKKEVKPNKKKTKAESLVKMEITPNSTKPDPPAKIKEEKPAPKKPRVSAGNYASYLHREGPRALGSKEIPEGEANCMEGLTFIITGVLETMERDEAKSLIETYGGKVMTTLSKNTKYIVIGRDAGASKLDKAEKLGTIQVDEDGLLDLVRTLPGKGPSKKMTPNQAKKSKPSPKTTAPVKKVPKMEEDFDMDSDDDFLIEAISEPPIQSNVGVVQKKAVEDSLPGCHTAVAKSESTEEKKSATVVKQQDTRSEVSDLFMWVDKYKPTSLKQVIGQAGDKSNAKKLLHWLTNWNKSRRLNKKAIPGRFNPADDGSAYKAALLSGPPGVGKTTTAILVCKETGFDHFELNASDTRSKKSLQQAVSQLLGNQTLGDCFKEEHSGKVSQKHAIIMDEVDGMAGNEDRGGMAEVIAVIKSSKVPIICICNDRNHPKIRSLSNYCFDLRFQKPRVEQIKAAMMSIAFKEHIQVTPEALQDVIVASNQDIRQVLHNMSMWSATSKVLSTSQTKSDVGKGTKHIKMGPFDVLREVFAIGNNPKATLFDKSDLFFHDYSIAPLFVQENYVHVIPTAAEGNKLKHLRLLSEAAESLSFGDIIDKQIRSQNSWGLLPTQAIFSSVLPGELLRGHLRQMISFPTWLGKNSNRNHMDRVLQELHVHMRMKITGNKTDVALDYLPLLKRALTKPLIEKEQEGVPQVLKTMEEYYLLREDFDSIVELSLWQNQTDPRTKIQTKVKSAFTRAYNKESGKNPYAVTNVKKKKASAKDAEADLGEGEEVESEEEEDDSIEKDAMIKVKKPPKKAGAEAGEPSTSKGKQKNPSKRGGKAK